MSSFDKQCYQLNFMFFHFFFFKSTICMDKPRFGQVWITSLSARVSNSPLTTLGPHLCSLQPVIS